MFTDGSGFFYTGDCRSGDRPATNEEIVAWEQERAQRVPLHVGSGQLIRALDELGHLAAVKQAVAQAQGLAVDLWVHSSRFERNDPMLVELAGAAGMDSSQVDAVFRLAVTK